MFWFCWFARFATVLMFCWYCCATVSAAFFEMSFIADVVTDEFSTPRLPRLLSVVPIVFWSELRIAFCIFVCHADGSTPFWSEESAVFALFALVMYCGESLPSTLFAAFAAAVFDGARFARLLWFCVISCCA